MFLLFFFSGFSETKRSLNEKLRKAHSQTRKLSAGEETLKSSKSNYGSDKRTLVWLLRKLRSKENFESFVLCSLGFLK